MPIIWYMLIGLFALMVDNPFWWFICLMAALGLTLALIEGDR